jgi:hypothetical protein
MLKSLYLTRLVSHVIVLDEVRLLGQLSVVRHKKGCTLNTPDLWKQRNCFFFKCQVIFLGEKNFPRIIVKLN